jgi:FMN phosphatase YigB (HAD superfamily)
MLKGSQIKAVAFDAYGTLVDIADKRRPFAQLIALSQKTPVTSPLIHAMDLTELRDALDVSLEDVDWSALQEDLAAELASIHPYPEASSVLEDLRAQGIRTAVASNLAKPYALPIQKELGPLLDVSCWSFDVGAVKPDAAFYGALCDLLNVDRSSILMVGDTWRCDYAGAVGAGLHGLHLDRRGNAAGDQIPVSIRDLRGITTALGLRI